jgi:hypothetical protein
MDPLSALSIAASVVQFVDFGTRLLSGTREVYKSASGQTKDIVELSTIVADLSQFSQNIREQFAKVDESRQQKTSTEEILLKTSANCLQTCADIQVAVSKLGKAEPPQSTDLKFAFGHQLGRVHKSFEVSFRNITSSKQIRTWQNRLTEAREQIVVSLLGLLW